MRSPSETPSTGPPPGPVQVGTAGSDGAFRPNLRGSILAGLRRLVIAGLRFLFWIVLITWSALAIHYSNLPWAGLRTGLAAAFAAFAVWGLWLSRRRHMPAVVVVLFLGVVAWWIAIPPSHNRPWRPEVAVMPRAVIDGDRVRLTGVRDFDYRSRNDFTVRYEDRDVLLSHLMGLDFYVTYWSEGLVGHTFVSFIFDNAPPLSISIETRPEVGEGFNPLASMFKQFELIYVVGDERDLVGVRANHRRETVYLYRLNTSAEAARRLLLVYLERINELTDRPEWYHLLSNNCTLNIIRYANAAGREGRFDIRHLFNGLIDSYLYHSGRVDTTLPFEELRRRSLINEAAQATDGAPDFSQRIRAALPTGPH
ncbi:Lnb N-terminal periplasmic domain-containing protein [Microvirga sp. P5_D2]